VSTIISHVILQGETVRSLAQKFFQDANRWSDIVVFNELDYPFISDSLINISSSSNVKVIGDVIFIPLDSDTAGIQEYESGQDLDSLVLGTDLELAINSELPINTHDGELLVDMGSGDYRLLSGFKCLSQDLIHRLKTEYGTLTYHPEYGSNFHTILGSKMSPGWKDKAEIEIIKTFRSDSRVLDVTDVVVTSVDSRILIKCNIITSRGQHLISSLI